MRSRNKVISIVLFLLVFVMLVSCRKQKAEWKGSIEEVEGVTVVKNMKEPMYSEDAFSVEEDLSIGEAQGSEEYMFSEAQSVAVADDERVYVLDSKEAHIKVFDRNGEYIKTIGKKGQGPGELQRPASLRITSQNEIVANDSAARKLHFFTLDGNFLRAVSQTKMSFFSDPKVDKEGKYMAKVPLGARPQSWKKGKLYTIEQDEEGYPVVKRYKVNWNI